MMALALKKKDYDEMLNIFYEYVDKLLILEEDKYPAEEILSEIKTAALLMQWITEEAEDKIVSHFGIGPGDLRTAVELSEWLIYSAGEIAKIFGLRDAVKKLSLLRIRISYGVREELLQLVSLRGIGRIRARNLYNSGYKTFSDIKKAKAEELEKIPAIGRALAEDIKRQIEAI